jgi:hypothetical protein
MATTTPNLGESLDALRTRLHEPVDGADVSTALEDLLARRLSAFDIVIHLERWRAVNDATAKDQLFEDNCLEALDWLYSTNLPNTHAQPVESGL